MRRCEGTRWAANEIARRFPPEPCVQRAARFYEAIVTQPFRKLCAEGVIVNQGQYVIDANRPFLITKECFKQLRIRKEALLIRLQMLEISSLDCGHDPLKLSQLQVELRRMAAEILEDPDTELSTGDCPRDL